MSNALHALRSTLHALFRRPPADPPRYGYSYSLYWTKVAREWDVPRREAVAVELSTLLARAEFVPNQAERRYRVQGVEGEHSGGSLVALDRVLRALLLYEEQGDDIPQDERASAQ
jgi:hypothetical protein